MADAWQEFRELMPITEQWTYLDHAAVAPLPRPTGETIQRWCQESMQEGDSVWPTWNRRLEQLRDMVAELIAADREEIALLPSTTAGINVVAEGFPWQPGDNVVTLENEFPSNLYPWLNLESRGVETRRVSVQGGEVDLNRLADCCDARTRIISVSWVGYSSGWRLNLDEVTRLAHQKNAFLFVDAIQGMGVFPINVQQTPVDFLAADGHKWMLGPEGAGVCYIRREHLELLRPLGVGWHSVEKPFEFGKSDLKLRAEASRYEGGSHNMCGFLGLAASLELIRSFGLSSDRSLVAEQVLRRTEAVLDSLDKVGAEILTRPPREHRSGIVTFRLPNQASQALRQRCLDAKIALSCRGGGLRISSHAYNNQTDLEHLIDTITAPTVS